MKNSHNDPLEYATGPLSDTPNLIKSKTPSGDKTNCNFMNCVEKKNKNAVKAWWPTTIHETSSFQRLEKACIFKLMKW